jgi:glutamate-1-semialdehyde 2,1-aminomutase
MNTAAGLVAPDGRTNSRIVAAYRERTPRSAALAAEAREVLPSGLTHDSRHLTPYGIYVERAAGCRKWDVDGNEYIDYFGGHGSLLLGHSHPGFLAAAQEALSRGTHFGANHELELRWARLVQRLVPSAERVRFTASGTEATHMALRLARAFTGRDGIVRFMTHFHGWHDHMASGVSSHFDGAATPGVLGGVADGVVLVPPGDLDAVAAALEARNDIAAIILEPLGTHTGQVPHRSGFLAELRDLTRRHGVLLIFDEVVSGFRVSPGGAQAHYGVLPDITTLAKIVSGGLPGGAVAGRRDILDLIDFDAAAAAGRTKIRHQGTYNANPVSAAAGIAALTVIAESDACQRAARTAERLRTRLNDVITAAGVPWAVYGESSIFHVFTNPARRDVTPATFDPLDYDFRELALKPQPPIHKLRLALLLSGVDITGWPGGTVSIAHDEDAVEATAEGLAKALHMLKEDGEL